MRKIVLLFFVALMAVPAMAASTVDITCSSEVIGDVNWITVSYSSDTNRIRAFGLDITLGVEDGNITAVEVLNPNYRIYPGQISIVDGDVNDYYDAYDPCDLGDNHVAVEMGSLYTTDANYASDANAGYNMIPALSGTLLKFAFINAGASDYTVDVNALRGGIVMEDPYETPGLESPLCGGPGCDPVPNIVGMDKDDADAAIVAAGYTVGTTDGVNSCETLDEVLTQDPAAGSTPGCGSPIDYTYSQYQTEVPNLLNLTQADANAALIAAGLTVGTIADGNGGAVAIGSVYAQGTASGTVVTCGTAVSYNVAAYCMKPTHPDYANWVLHGRPRCWCYAKQCRGDINGTKEGLFWVGNTDKTILVTYLNKFPNPTPPFAGICADLNHTKEGLFWVGNSDKNIMVTYLNKITPPTPDCDSTHINFWCNPDSTTLGCP